MYLEVKPRQNNGVLLPGNGYQQIKKALLTSKV
jgi:hypothetical protein